MNFCGEWKLAGRCSWYYRYIIKIFRGGQLTGTSGYHNTELFASQDSD